MTRRPRGYVGKNHETIGSDILALVKSLKLPQLTLGKDIADRLVNVSPTGWYPIAWLLEAMETLEAKLGASALRQMGQILFRMSHADRVAPPSAKAVIHGIDAMYHHANRGDDIGGWKVLRFAPGYAELEKNTPHHCVMEEGILNAALTAAGVNAAISQSQCFRKGGDVCVYKIEVARVDARWGT